MMEAGQTTIQKERARGPWPLILPSAGPWLKGNSNVTTCQHPPNTASRYHHGKFREVSPLCSTAEIRDNDNGCLIQLRFLRQRLRLKNEIEWGGVPAWSMSGRMVRHVLSSFILSSITSDIIHQLTQYPVVTGELTRHGNWWQATTTKGRVCLGRDRNSWWHIQSIFCMWIHDSFDMPSEVPVVGVPTGVTS